MFPSTYVTENTKTCTEI